jgi:SpoVK/Ycf46/Vps4 family AAA+-type ATPase
VTLLQVHLTIYIPSFKLHSLGYAFPFCAKTQGSDIMLVCKESAMRRLRDVMKKLEAMDAEEAAQQSGSGAPGTKKEKIDVSLDPITHQDIVEAIRVTRGVSHANLDKYVDWTNEFSSA